MNNAILKIDSFNQRNIVLINGTPVPMNSEFMNYYSKPISEVAGKILETIEAEFNDSFILDVYGNAFEQALLTTTIQKNGCSMCEKCNVHNTTIALSLQERMALIKDYVQSNITLPLALLADDTVSNLPAWNNIQFNDTAERKIIVTADTRFALDNVQRGDFVILVDVQAEDLPNFGKNCVVCCTANNLQAVIEGCIGTCLLNAKIAQVIEKLDLRKDPVKGVACLVEPAFFMPEKITLDKEKGKVLPMEAVPKDADFSKLRIKIREPIVKIENGKLVGVAAGSTILEGYVDSPIPIFSTQIDVVEHNYVYSIKVKIEDRGGTLCVGKSYSLKVAILPAQAEDAGSLAIECLTPETAKIEGGQIVVMAAGEVIIKAQTAHTEETFKWVAKQNVMEIAVSAPPAKVCIGDTFPISATITPKESYDSAYKWITSDASVAVVGVDKFGNELVKATGIGKATIRCVSVVDKSIFGEIEVEVQSTFTKTNTNSTFASAVLLAAITFVLSLLGVNGLLLIVGAVASMYLVLKAHNRKQCTQLVYLGLLIVNAITVILSIF